jgi:hypothetical protein
MARYVPGTAQIDRERFERVRESGSAERYRDRFTGDEMSKRQAIKQSIGLNPEQRVTVRKELGIYQPHRAGIIEKYLSKKGQEPRGAGKPKWDSVKKKLNDSRPLDSSDPRGGNWVNILYEEYDEPDFWDDFDWDDFFYLEEGK